MGKKNQQLASEKKLDNAESRDKRENDRQQDTGRSKKRSKLLLCSDKQKEGRSTKEQTFPRFDCHETLAFLFGFNSDSNEQSARFHLFRCTNGDTITLASYQQTSMRKQGRC